MITIEQISMKFSMDMGSPIPKIISTDNKLVLLFNVDIFDGPNITDKIHELSNENGACTAIIKFNKSVIHKFGSPNDEVIIGHPYYNMGLRAYSFWKVNDSDWKKEIIRINAHHPYFNENSFDSMNHYILTFKDNTFECLAESYDLEYSYNSLDSVIQQIAREIV